MDAKAAHGFHQLREKNPRLAFSRASNQFWYGYFSCSSGWFCGSTPLNKGLELELLSEKGGSWVEQEVPQSVRAIVFLNLQSYGGGRDLWRHDHKVRDCA
jgi:diacylglycerol kinase (ATP)